MYVKEYIKIKDLKDGYLYEIIARNAKYGIWREVSKGFLISRIKFGSNYIFEEYHYDFSNFFGTAQPVKEIEQSPFQVSKNDFENSDKQYQQLMIEYLNKLEGDRSYQWPNQSK